MDLTRASGLGQLETVVSIDTMSFEIPMLPNESPLVYVTATLQRLIAKVPRLICSRRTGERSGSIVVAQLASLPSRCCRRRDTNSRALWDRVPGERAAYPPRCKAQDVAPTVA